MTTSRLCVAVAATLTALACAATAAARPPLGTTTTKAPQGGAALVRGPYVAVSRLAALPANARPGAVYRLRGLVTNSGSLAAVGPVSIHLMRPGAHPRVIGSTTIRVGARRSLGYTVAVRLPRGLHRGSYSVLACSHRMGASGPLGCATAARHLTVGSRAKTPTSRVLLSSLADCSSGAHTLAAPGSRVYPNMGNGGYTSVHTDVTINYDAPTNLFLPGTHVDLTDQATQCLTDLSVDFEPTSTNATAGPNMTVGSVTVNGQPATFAFVQPTYAGDPNGQNDPDPLAHAVSNVNPVSATNPNPPACSPTVNGTAQNGQQCPATKLVITPSTPIPSGATFVVTVNYTGRPGVHNDGDGTTEGWFRNGTSGGFVTTEPVGTMAWMPLNNFPTAKPTYDFFDTVNTGKTAIANGELISFTDNAPDANFPAGSRTWHWRSPERVANYLVENSIDSFDFSQRLAASGITYYEAQGSTITASRKVTNKAIMDQQEDITTFQSQFNGPFPFTTDGVVIGVPSASFEEEMQTKITFAGGSISLGTFNHENMHQWWGDNVNAAAFNLIFWKEGWATVGEYLATARTAQTAAGGAGTPAGDAAFQTSLINRFNTNYNTTSATFWTVAPSNPTVGNLFTTANTYTRPGTAYLALWQVLGQSTMVATMQQIQRDYGGGAITEPQLEAEFHQALHNQSAECSAKLDQFFTQWFDTAYPTGGANTPNRPQITGPGLAGPGFLCAGLDYTGPTSAVWGTPTTFSGTLTDQNGNPLANKNVTFSIDGGAPQATTTDGDGEASFTPDGLLAPGTHSVALSFDGAGGYGVTTDSATLAVSKADQTIAFDALPDTTYGAPDFGVAATASSGLSVTFSASGSCTVTGSTVHVTGGGSCSVTASQAGSDTYNPAPDVTRTFAIARATQTIAFGTLDDRTFGNADFDISANASSGLTVSLAVTSGPCTLSAITSPATVHIGGAGTCAITASQAGDGNYLPAADEARSFTIGKANQAISFAPLADRTFGSPDFTVAATVPSGLPVSFAAAGNCTLTGATVHLAAAGSCTITASQAGNADYNPAPDVARTFAILKADQTIAFAPLADRVFGADFTVAATSSSGLAVSFAAGPGSRCTVRGTTVHMVAAGPCAVIASQGGSSDYNAAPPVSRTFAILNSAAGQASGRDLKPHSGGNAAFEVGIETHGHTTSLRGMLVYVGPKTPGRHGHSRHVVAGVITSFGVAADGRSAWFAGVTIDHRSFRAYVEDNTSSRKPKSTADVFKLWVDDELQTGDGSLDSGVVDISTSSGR